MREKNGHTCLRLWAEKCIESFCRVYIIKIALEQSQSSVDLRDLRVTEAVLQGAM